jgi:hypothetical protein
MDKTVLYGHDADWCRDCQEGCGDAYGGACPCCTEWSREDDEADTDA